MWTKYVRRRSRTDRCCYLVSLLCFGIFWILSIVAYILLKLNPEVGMVAHSQCINPLRGWDGKILNTRVWQTNYDSYPSNFYIHENSEPDSFDRRRLSSSSNEEAHSDAATAATTPTNLRHEADRSDLKGEKGKRPVIMWGTHHKTGTYLAQKIFALLCNRQRWCCVFQPTRASIHTVKDALASEDLHVLGHSQWVWHPKELGVPYKFVHFYRHPFRKIVSGFRYHREGAEAWTKRVYQYNDTCRYKELKESLRSAAGLSSSSSSSPSFHGSMNSSSSSSSSSRLLSADPTLTALKSNRPLQHTHHRHTNSTGHSGHHLARNRRSEAQEEGLSSSGTQGPGSAPLSPRVSRAAVVEYCRAIKLCQTCCRREHETDIHGTHSEIIAAFDRSIAVMDRTYSARADTEYSFVCGSLGTIAGAASLSRSHTIHTVAQGLLVEAGLQYFENLRMARIFNATAEDPHSLQIDIDDLITNYSATMRRILKHIGIEPTHSSYYGIIGALKFFDIKTSFLYKWNMASQNHIDHTRPRYQLELMDILKSNDQILAAYKPILEMLQDKKKNKQAFTLDS